MYFGGSVVGKASTVGTGISPTPPLIFTWGKKCEIWRRLKQRANFSRLYLNMQQAIRILSQCCDDRPMSWLSWFSCSHAHTPEKAMSVLKHPLKLHPKTH